MRSVLFDYYKHVSTCSNTMLTRLCGLHAIRLKDKSGQILGGKGGLVGAAVSAAGLVLFVSKSCEICYNS